MRSVADSTVRARGAGAGAGGSGVGSAGSGGGPRRFAFSARASSTALWSDWTERLWSVNSS